MDSKLKVTSQDDTISTSEEILVKTKNSETPIKLKSSETPIKLKSSETPITNIIGSGEDAKNSIIYLVLKWAFFAAVAISTLVIINNWLFRDCENKVPDITSDLKVIWEIVTPIITLALGYAFGKSEK